MVFFFQFCGGRVLRYPIPKWLLFLNLWLVQRGLFTCLRCVFPVRKSGLKDWRRSSARNIMTTAPAKYLVPSAPLTMLWTKRGSVGVRHAAVARAERGLVANMSEGNTNAQVNVKVKLALVHLWSIREVQESFSFQQYRPWCVLRKPVKRYVLNFSKLSTNRGKSRKQWPLLHHESEKGDLGFSWSLWNL